MNEKPKVAIYARVSTDKQELENQLLQLRNYSDQSKWEIFKEYTDIISGAKDKRPGFDSMFADAYKKLFDISLFWDLSRFSRGGMAFTVNKLQELENLGIKWHSFREPHVNTDNELTRNVTIAIMSSIAKIEREKISERTKAGLARAKKNGKYLGRKPIPTEVTKKVEKLLSLPDPPSYRKISKMVTYKIKYGKIKHVSVGQIALINKNLRSKKGSNNCLKKNV